MTKQKTLASLVASNLKPDLKQDLKPDLTPQEKLSQSRSEIVNLMQRDDHIFQIFQPVVTGYAKTNPMKTLGIAAGIGAAIVVLKPWRLITIGSLIAVLRSRF
jgi:ElaB/YqjD/DUF883 family membrane-anchored ribosome-binding protein